MSKVVLQQLHHRAALVSFDLDIGILDDGPWRRRPLRPAGEPDRAPSPVLRGGKGLLLFVSLQFPLSPMMGFSRRVEHALDVTVQRLHEANPRSIVGPPGHQYQGFHRRLPFRRSLRKLGDVVAGILQGDQRQAARQRNRFVEAAGPGQSLRRN